MSDSLKTLVEHLRADLGNMVAATTGVVLEVEHERCPDGSHWNDKEGKCMELPPALASRHAAADERSDRAAKASKQAHGARNTYSRQQGHQAAEYEHDRAERQHRKLATDLKDAGFGELADHHGIMAGHHESEGGDHRAQLAKLMPQPR